MAGGCSDHRDDRGIRIDLPSDRKEDVMSDRRIFKCVLCPQLFGLDDVKTGMYFPSTGVCYNCYKRGSKVSVGVWCFGKPVIREGNRIVRIGYDEKARACRVECPDSHICKVFVAERKETKDGRKREGNE